VEEESTHQSRLFVILAIALIGLLVLGLLGIGGVFVIRQNLQEQAALAQPTPTLMIKLPNPTATFTPVKPAATNTPMPTATNTPVVEAANKVAAAGEKAAVSNPVGTQPTKPGLPIPSKNPATSPEKVAKEQPKAVPNTGWGGLEIALIAIGLVIVLFVARRWRMSM